VHAVTLITHAQCMQCHWHCMYVCVLCHWHRMHGASSINDTACTMHAVSLKTHAKYDTACTINEQFERPWQPLKGISIKNIYVPKLSYPTTKKIYKFKGNTCT
jgi:hypothetical protein